MGNFWSDGLEIYYIDSDGDVWLVRSTELHGGDIGVLILDGLPRNAEVVAAPDEDLVRRGNSLEMQCKSY